MPCQALPAQDAPEQLRSVYVERSGNEDEVGDFDLATAGFNIGHYVTTDTQPLGERFLADIAVPARGRQHHGSRTIPAFTLYLDFSARHSAPLFAGAHFSAHALESLLRCRHCHQCVAMARFVFLVTQELHFIAPATSPPDCCDGSA